MSTLETLEKIDHQIFFYINDKWSCEFFDLFFPIFTDLHKHKWFVFGALPLTLGFWIYKKRGQALKIILGMILATSMADAINTRLLKPRFQRERPPSSGVHLILRTDRFGGYSMPSNHSTNIFTASTFLAIALPALRIPVLLIAASVAYSRIYVGVHFPGDVFIGALLGFFYAFFVSKIYYALYHAISVRLMLYLKK